MIIHIVTELVYLLRWTISQDFLKYKISLLTSILM